MNAPLTWIQQGNVLSLRTSRGRYAVYPGPNGKTILWWENVDATQARVVGGHYDNLPAACAAAEAMEPQTQECSCARGAPCSCAKEGGCPHSHPATVPTTPCNTPAAEKRPPSVGGFVNRLDFDTESDAKRVARSLRRRAPKSPQYVLGKVLYTNAPTPDIAGALQSTKVRPTFQSIGAGHEPPSGVREDALVIHENGVFEASEEMTRVTRDPKKFEACMAKSRAMGPLDNSDKVYALLREHMAKQDQEVFVVVPLDLHHHLRGCAPIEVARGQRSSVTVSVTDVLRAGIREGATTIVVAHNHPSGLVKPSPKDLELTAAIIDGCKKVGLGIDDHLIIGTSRYYSIREHHKGLWK